MIMKTYAISLMVTGWLLLSSFHSDPLPSTNGPAEGESDFQLVRSEKSIQIYSRWIPVGNNRSAREMRISFSVGAPLGRTVNVLLNDSSVTKWMSNTHSYFRLSTIDSSHWYSYVRFSVPWPLRDQDCIIGYTLKQTGKQIVEIRLTGSPGYIEPVCGVTRILHMEGLWKFVGVQENKTLVEYTIFSNQTSSFPRWITDPIIQNTMIKTMEGFREQVGRHTGGQPDKREKGVS